MDTNDPGEVAIRAIKRPASERQAFLDSACAGDAELRKRVIALIKVYEESGRFSEDLPPETQAFSQRERIRQVEEPGTRIGHYKLLQHIGEGGFGVVYMAEQHEPVRRKVALKVVKPGMDTGEVIARFEAERKALALMDHPNIAKVLDAGTTDSGRPYFVMELVRGVSITEYSDKNRLTTRERLDLFTSVCHAVQHAHQKGIIHRDLKPSNILVTLHDGKPVPKVIDFGVAKALHRQLTERTLFTAYGQVVGTPQYMSPEQAEMSGLDIDTRSDIYSLGVLLYELLTGSTPFDGQRLCSAGFAEMLRIIREEEPPKPSTRVSTAGNEATVVAQHRSADPQKLSQQLRGELDWIVMKALDKDRNRRYANANGLAADLRRYLDNEPVSACPPSASYRMRKFVRRNKKLVAATSAIGLVLLIGVTLSAAMAVRAVDAARVAARLWADEVDARSDAERARQNEIEQRKQAEIERDRALEAERRATRQRNRAVASELKAAANFEEARDTVDRYLTTVSENQLLTVPGMQPLRQELLDSALTFHERFVAERQDDKRRRASLGSVYLRLGDVHRDLHEQGKAKEHLAKAQELFETMVRHGDDSPDMLRQLAEVYYWLGRYPDTVILCKRVLKDLPDNCDARMLLANTYNTLAIGSKNQARRTEALRIHANAFAIRRQLVESHPGNPKYLGDLSSTINNVGVILGSRGEGAKALDMYRLARQYVDAAFARAPYSMLYGRFAATSRRNVAIGAAGMDLQEEALNAYRDVVAAWNLLAINNPGVASYKSERYQAYQQLATYQRQIGQLNEAASTLRLARQSVENLPQENADDLYDLAKVYAALAQSRGPEQKTMAQLAVRSLARAAAKGDLNIPEVEKDPALAGIRNRDDCQRLLAVWKIEKEIGEVSKSLEERERVENLRKNLENYDKDELARIPLTRALRTLAGFYERADEFDEARTLLERATSLLEGNSDDPHTALDALAIRCDLGRLHWARREYAEAHRRWQVCLEQSLELAQSHRQDRHLQKEVSIQERAIFHHYASCGLFPLARAHAARSAELDRVRAGSLGVGPDAEGGFAAVVLAKGDGELARRYFRQFTESMRDAGYQGTSDLIHLVRGIAAIGDRDLLTEELLSQFQSVFDGSSGKGWVAVGMAMVHYCHGRYTEAQSILEGFRQDSTPQIAFLDAAIAAKLGDREHAQQRWSEGESRYGRSCRDALTRDVANNNNGIFDQFWWQFAYDQAMRRLALEAMSEEPPTDDPWENLIQARGYRLIGEVEKAEAELAAASAAATEGADVRLARVRLLGEWGEIERAEAEWQKVVDLTNDDPMPWIHRGRWYAERHEHEKADADFAQATSRFANLSEEAQLEIADRLPEWGRAVALALPERLDGPFRTLITRDYLVRLLPDASRTKGAEQTFCQRMALRQFKAQLEILDPGWELTRIVFLPGCKAAQYNPRDGRLYVGTRMTDSDGLYAIDPDGTITRIADADKVAAVAVQPETGHIFVSEDHGGKIYRTAFGTTGREAWVSELKSSDSDPGGMAFATRDYAGKLLAPGEGLVVDWGHWHAPDEIYRFSSATPNQSVLLHSDGDGVGPLVSPLDVTIGVTGVFIVDWLNPQERGPGCIYRVGEDGSLTLVQTDEPIAAPTSIATDPLTGDLFVADSGGKRLLRVDPKTGATNQIVTGLSCRGWSPACVDVAPDGRQVFITDNGFDDGSHAILTFTVRTATDYAKAIEQEPDDPAPWLRRARFHAFGGGLENALSDFDKAVELGPDNSVTWTSRALFHTDRGQPDQARADIDKAIEVAPDDWRVWRAAGEVHEKFDRWDKAMADYGKAIELAPVEWPFWKARAENLGQSKRWDKAIALYNNLVEHNPGNCELWRGRAAAHFQLAQWDKAIEDYGQVIKLRSDDSQALSERAKACFHMKQWEQAIEDCSRAIELRPDDAAAYVWRSAARREKGEHAKAIEDCTAALRISPKSIFALGNRATAYRVSGRYREALQDANRGQLIEPDNVWMRRERAAACFELKQWDKAIEAYGEAIKLRPDQAVSYVDRSRAHRQKGDYAKAVDDCTSALRVDPKHVGAFHNWAIACRLAGRYEEALEAANAGLFVKPDLMVLLWERALAYDRMGAHDKAIADYNEAIRLAPETANLFRYRAETYLSLGRYDEALDDWARSMDLGPDNTVAALIRSQILLMADRTQEYRQTCVEILERYPLSDCHVARSCALGPKAVLDPMVPLELAVRAVSRDSREWTLYTLGMTYLRAGQLKKAAEYFDESLNISPDWKARFLDWLGLALVHHHRGETEETRQWLGKAVDLMEQHPEIARQDRFEGQILRREVERLLEQPGQQNDSIEDAQAELQHTYPGEPERVVVRCTKAIELDPDNAQLYVTRGNIHFAQQRWEQATADFARAGDLKPDLWPLWKVRAELFAQSDHWDGAIALYTKIIEHHADKEEFWQARAKAHAQLQQWGKAIEDYGEVIRLEPADFYPYAARAQYFAKIGEYDRVIADCNEAIRLNPRNWFPYAARANARVKTDCEKAIADCNEAIRLLSTSSYAYIVRANAYVTQGNYEKAIADCDQAIRLDPMKSWLYSHRAAVHAVCGQWAEADADATQAEKMDPDDQWAAHLRAGLLLLRGDTDGYHRTCAQMLQRFGGTTKLGVREAVVRACALESKAPADPERLVQLAQQELAARPNSAAPLYALAIGHYRAGQFDQAVQRLEESLEVTPRWEAHALSWLGLAMAYHRKGDDGQARKWMEKVRKWAKEQKLALRSDPTALGALPLHHPGDNIECLILLGEAEQLMSETSDEG